MMTGDLSNPELKLEWTDNFSSYNDISEYVRALSVRRCDLNLGHWWLTAVIDDKEGTLSKNTFPAIDTERGLHTGFRVYINDKIRGLFRGGLLIPEFGHGRGEIIELKALGFGRELSKRRAFGVQYQMREVDYIISYLLNLSSLDDIAYNEAPWTGTEVSALVPDAPLPSLREAIVEIANDVDYVAYPESTAKPAPMKVFAKADTSKRLNTVLEWGNNVTAGKNPRSELEVINYLTLDRWLDLPVDFTTDIPWDEDAFTELEVEDNPNVWTAVVGNLYTDYTSYAAGEMSIRIEGTYLQLIEMMLDLGESKFGDYMNPDDFDVNRLTIQHKEEPCIIGIVPRITLRDSADHYIYQNYVYSSSFVGKSFNIGTAYIGDWSGDTGSFNWDIYQISFEDTSDHSAESGDQPKLWIDKFRFHKASGYEETYLSDATSITDHGRGDRQLGLPSTFPYLNTYQWGLKILNKLKNPQRTLELLALIDPATVKEDDDSTPADFLPGWSVQVKAPRWKVEKVTDGGIWWRILETLESIVPGVDEGYKVQFTLVPTGSESPEDYSSFGEDQMMVLKDPYMARLRQLNKEMRRYAFERILSLERWK